MQSSTGLSNVSLTAGRPLDSVPQSKKGSFFKSISELADNAKDKFGSFMLNHPSAAMALSSFIIGVVFGGGVFAVGATLPVSAIVGGIAGGLFLIYLASAYCSRSGYSSE